MSGIADVRVAGQEIRLEHVSKSYGTGLAADDVNLIVPAGSFTVLLGPSGCGKSTTLRMIAGLEETTDGRILIGDRDVTRVGVAQRNLSMVFQSYALFPHLSVAENITFGLKVRKVSRAERQRRLQTVASVLGLEALLERKPGQLSGGQQQRVALGRAIIAEKPVCLMDEPLSNLDAKLRHEMRVEIRALQQQLGFTMVYVTHDQVEAITMADQVVLLNGGRIEQVADPRTLYARPATMFAARFIGTPPMNLIPASALPVEALPRGTRSDDMIGVRPEALILDASGPVRGVVRSVEYLGSDTLVDLDVDGALVQARLPGQDMPAPGTLLAFGHGPDDLHVFDPATGRRREGGVVETGLPRQSN
ncbi:ABC transporter ATP-binding protein [Roseibium aestuarii]|uniref:ABC transporter ATP-binding protein n=1 Tax=Roseibium aestuarii TaxID=2600299 RepID=A0ABW4JV39_9HYPH|nr:ABC transporter ATP-binding protein [Roseibium aestuarii]